VQGVQIRTSHHRTAKTLGLALPESLLLRADASFGTELFAQAGQTVNPVPITPPSINTATATFQNDTDRHRQAYEKARLVAKLRAARQRKRETVGKCEGRKSHAERNPELVALVRQLRRRRPKGGTRSLRKISAELAQRGIMNERGTPFSAASIASMLERRSV
jgi:hypothetical protein